MGPYLGADGSLLGNGEGIEIFRSAPKVLKLTSGAICGIWKVRENCSIVGRGQGCRAVQAEAEGGTRNPPQAQ